MVLYSANLSELATAVPKKGKKNVPVESGDAPVLTKAQETRKRKREEKDAAATEAAEAKAAKEEAATAKKEAAKQKRAAKKAAAPVTPSVTVEDDQEETNTEEAIEAALAELMPPPAEKKIAKPKTQKPIAGPSDDTPPKWFNAYVQGVKSEEAKQSKIKKPRKVIVQESKHAADQAWKQGLTRDRVTTEVNDHMNRMYSQIFGARRMK